MPWLTQSKKCRRSSSRIQASGLEYGWRSRRLVGYVAAARSSQTRGAHPRRRDRSALDISVVGAFGALLAGRVGEIELVYAYVLAAALALVSTLFAGLLSFRPFHETAVTTSVHIPPTG